VTIYDVKEIGLGWVEIVTKIDGDGKSSGGFLIPMCYLMELVKIADKVMPIVKEGLGI